MTRSFETRDTTQDPTQTVNEQVTEHPERLPRDANSQVFFGEPRPGDPQHPIDEDPDAERKGRIAKFIAFGGIGVLATAVIGGYAYSKNSADKILENTYGGAKEPGVSAPVVPGIDEASSVNLSRERVVGTGEEYLASQREESVKELKNIGFSVSPEYTEDASDKGLADGFTVDLYSAWKLGQSNEFQAEQVLSSIVDPESDDYERYASMIGEGASPILASVKEVGDSTKNFYSNNFMAADGSILVKSNGNAMRALTSFYQDEPNSTSSGIVNQVIFQRVNGLNSNGETSQKWMIKQMSSSDDPDYIGNLKLLDLN